MLSRRSGMTNKMSSLKMSSLKISIRLFFLIFHQHIIELRKNAAAMIFIAGILFGLLLTPVLRLFAECLINSFLQEPDSEQNYEDEGLGKDEVDEDEEEEGKKAR